MPYQYTPVDQKPVTPKRIHSVQPSIATGTRSAYVATPLTTHWYPQRPLSVYNAIYTSAEMGNSILGNYPRVLTSLSIVAAYPLGTGISYNTVTSQNK